MTETVFNECEGLEPIRVSGVAHFVLRVMVDESHGELDIHDVEHSGWERVKGVGQETGASYVVKETFNNVLERKDSGANDFTFVFKINIIGRGVIDNYLYKARAHMTLNANDEVTVMFFDYGATCRG